MKGYLASDNKYIVSLEIPCYQVDIDKKLTPTAFMDLAQEMAYLAAGSLHFGYEDLIPRKMAWVLSRMHITFENTPSWEDEVEISTWSKGPLGPFYIRDFFLKDASGDVLVRCTSSWVVLDLNARKMCRPSEIQHIVPENSVCLDNAIDTPAERLVPPKNLTFETVASHIVNYSDIDLIGHTNNVKYVSWSLDCIGLDKVRGGKVKDIWINFSHETTAGEAVVMEKAFDGECCWIEGKVDGLQAFLCKIRL